jgi:hypothetical protein
VANEDFVLFPVGIDFEKANIPRRALYKHSKSTYLSNRLMPVASA